jgi:hypothetical protein
MNESDDFKAGRAYERGLWRRALFLASESTMDDMQGMTFQLLQADPRLNYLMENYLPITPKTWCGIRICYSYLAKQDELIRIKAGKDYESAI